MEMRILVYALLSIIKPSPHAAAAEIAEGAVAVARQGVTFYSSTATTGSHRTSPSRPVFAENCDYLAHYCLKAYDTGKLCARTLYYAYYTFKTYCMMSYVNCMERYEVWQVVHMGECYQVTELADFLRYYYMDDYFLDQDYILEDH